MNFAKVGMYRSIFLDPISTYYIFRKRGLKEKRLLRMFGYGEDGKEWSAGEFYDYQKATDVPADKVEAYEFEHCTLFNVPHEVLNPAEFVRRTLAGWDGG